MFLCVDADEVEFLSQAASGTVYLRFSASTQPSAKQKLKIDFAWVPVVSGGKFRLLKPYSLFSCSPFHL